MDEIKYPKRHSETEIQAVLWTKLRKQGIDARLQVFSTVDKKNCKRRCKFDIVVFRDQIPQSIIECKSWSRRYSEEWLYQYKKNRKQIRKYEDYGLPVFICGRPEDITSVLEQVVSSYEIQIYEPIQT